MRKLIILLLGVLLAATPLAAQKLADQPESSTFGLDERDAAAVRKIRYRMAQIRKSRPTVALVLSGGGAKGAATVGVLKYLEQYDFPIDMVVGTSIGGLVGGMYALGYDADYLDSLFRNMDWSMALTDKVDKSYIPYARTRYKEKFLLSFPFYYKTDDYKNFLRGDMPFAAGRSREIHLGASSGEEGQINDLVRGNFLGSLPSGFVFGQNVNQIITSRTVGYSDSTDFFKFPIPFACVATDMATGRAKIWHDGSVNLALRSTMSIPGLFAPVRTEGMVLVDGGMRNNFPVNIAREMGADIIIGIDLSNESPTAEEIQNLGDILSSTMDLFEDDAHNLNVQLVDVHVHPDLTGYNMLSFNREAVDTMYRRGYLAAEQVKPQLDAIRHRLGKARHKFNGKPAVDLGKAAVLIQDIDIVGVSEREADYLLSKMKIKPGTVATKEMIEDEVATIFGKGAYDYVTYELRGKQEPYRLRILCKRGPMHQIGFGARIDSRDIVSLLLNVGFNTHAMRGSSLDITGRISMNPYLDLHYIYNTDDFATFNLRGTLQYAASSAIRVHATYGNVAMLSSGVEAYFSNMHWSSMDVKLGIRGRYYNAFKAVATSESGVDYSTRPGEDAFLPSVFMDGRVETLDDGYFPTRGVSVGVRGELSTDFALPGKQQDPSLLYIAQIDGKFPFTFGRLSFIPQYNVRMIFGKTAPFHLYNMIGGDMAGKYVEHQIPFIGTDSVTILSNHLGLLRLDARYQIAKNNYVSLLGNWAYSFESLPAWKDGKQLLGVGVRYSYDSIVGPISAQLHWSSISKSLGLYLSMGYHF